MNHTPQYAITEILKLAHADEGKKTSKNEYNFKRNASKERS